MEEKDFNESNEETRVRGVKRASENKIAEVSTSKKKRAKKPLAEAPEPAQAQINFNDEEEQSEESAKRSRMFEAVKDVAGGNISLQELTVALNNAVWQEERPQEIDVWHVKVHFIILPKNRQQSN
jgi:hypothetical protein